MFSPDSNEQSLSVQEARTRTRGDQPQAVLLDVREAAEWARGRTPGAVHAPLSDPAAGGVLPAAAQGRALAVICRSGSRSQKAAMLMARQGADAVNVEGGMNAWTTAGYPVVDERGNHGSTA